MSVFQQPANRKFCQIVGYSETDLKSLNFKALIDADDVEDFESQVQQLRFGALETRSIETQLRTHNEPHVRIRVRLSSVTGADDPPDFIVAVMDELSLVLEFSQDKSSEASSERSKSDLTRERDILKLLVRTLPDLVWLKDADGVYLACNPEFERFFGATEAQIVGKTDYDFVDRGLADFFRDHDRQALAIDVPTKNEEWITFAEDGSRALLETTKTRMVDEAGRVVGVLGIGHDITDRKRIEQALRESSQRYDAVLSTTKDGFWLVNSDARLVDVNDMYCEYTGFTREELLGKGVWEIDLDETRESVFQRLEEFKRTGSAIFEAVHLCKDGTSWAVEVSVSYSPIQSGQFFVFMRDIVERKLIEDALRNESRKLRDANHLAGLAHWEMDLATGSVYWSPEMYEILECDPMLDPTRVPEANRHFDEDSWQRLSAAIQNCSENGESYELDLRVPLSEGGIRWVTARGQAIFDDKHRISGVRGTVQDITRRKQDEENIQRFATIFEHAAWGMVIADAKTERITHVNPAFARMHGYAIDELIGKPVLMMYAPEVREQVPGFVDKAHTDGHLMVETMHVRKDGDTFPCRIDVTVYTDEAGEPLFRAANIEDITESRRTQKALQEAAERYRSVIQTSLDGYWVINDAGQLKEVNDAYCQMSGYARDELLMKSVWDLDALQSEAEVNANLQRVMHEKSIIFESQHRRKNGESWDVEVVVSYAPIQGGRFFCFFRDITIRKREQALVMLRQTLTDRLKESSQESLMRYALDAAELATDSDLGCVHVVDPDQESVSLRVWSTRTLGDNRFLDSSQVQDMHAQLVGESLKTHNAVFLNDAGSSVAHCDTDLRTASVHALSVPLIRDGHVVAVLCVVGKHLPYSEHDLKLVQEIAGIAHDFRERKRAEEQIEFMAYYDVLTRLPNRTLLSDRLRQAMAQAHRSNQLVGVCYLDLDGFTPVNDHYGHEVGDKLLVRFAANVMQSLREGDTLARMGGDEFVVLLTGLKSAYECEDVVERILSTIQVPIRIESHRVHLSASIGVTLYPTDAVDAETLLRHADQAMYEAKTTGKSKFRIYDPIKDQNVLAMRQLLVDFESALHTGQLFLHYQPKIDLRNGAVTGVEALIRWNHPKQGILYPADFLPAIEDTPQELALGEWVARRALDQHEEWLASGIPLSISINICPRQMQMLEFAEFLSELLKAYPQGAAERLEIEMLEIAAIGNIEKATAVMNACAELGIRFSLDDFGTGYSSLTYFHRLPIDIVKIDQHFVREILSNMGDLDIVEGVLRLADVLKRPVVAEGVESIEIGMILLSLGCNYAQGFGIARPMGPEDVGPWLNKWQTVNPWRDTLSEFTADPEHYHTNVAIISHKLWLETVTRYVQNGGEVARPALGDDECQFAQWYSGIGRIRYADTPGYEHIEHAHHSVHQVAKRIVRLVESGDQVQAEKGLVELYAMAENMTRLLKKLED
ncbi:MAG: PAS domain S-box protein [Candidatus Thiodiazotropha sp.]